MQLLAMQSISELNHLGHLWHNAFIPGVISLIVFFILLFIVASAIVVKIDNGHMPSDITTIVYCVIMIDVPFAVGMCIFAPHPISTFGHTAIASTVINHNKQQVRNHHKIKVLKKHAYNDSELSHEHQISKHKSYMYYLTSEHDLDKVHNIQHYDKQVNHEYIHVGKPQWYNY